MTSAIILVVLLVGLGFSFVKMMSALNTPRKRSSANTTAAAASSTSSSETSATKMPPVPTTSGSKRQAGAGSAAAASDTQLNRNQFRVFDLNPPKNPFVQEEEWYSGVLLEDLPGYPELKTSDYFDRPEAFLPDIELIDENEWESITIERATREDQFEIHGVSEDGKTETSLRLKAKTVPDQRIEWTPESGVPLEALKNPGWYETWGAQLEQAALKIPDSVDGGIEATPDGDDMRAGENNGDAVYVVGLSRKGGRVRALVQVNDRAFMVSEGSVIPTHWQVLEIKENGVVLVDLHDGESRWVELGPAPKISKQRGRET